MRANAAPLESRWLPFQGVSADLGRFETKLAAARFLSMNALWLKDNGLGHTAEAATAKRWPPRLANEAIHACLLIHGHAGYGDDLPFARRLRVVLGLQIGDRTVQIMKNIIARESAGRDAVSGQGAAAGSILGRRPPWNSTRSDRAAA